MTGHVSNKLEQDDLARDLIKIVRDCDIPKNLREGLLTELTLYIVDRDHKIRTRAFAAGRASA